MINRSRDVKLYNVIFPLWMLLLFPQAWLIILPGNFIIDSLVLIVSMFILKLADKKQIYKRCILKIFCFGMLSDMIGAGFMMLMVILEISTMGDELFMTIPALVIAAGLIFVLNYFFTFNKMAKPTRLKLALTFAIVTAPYTFLVPISWLY